MTIKTVILDRDGVINYDSDSYIKSPNEFKFLDNAIQAVDKLFNNNIALFICTNQSGINRKLYSLDDYISISNKLILKINNKVKAIYYCPHIDSNNCSCRKPLPGMINKIKQHYGINLMQTAFIGDSLRDLQAADKAGCQYKFLVQTGKGLATYNKANKSVNKDITKLINNKNTFTDLNCCVDYIIENNL